MKIEFEIDLNTFKQWRRYARPRSIVAILVATLMVIGHADLATMIFVVYFVVGLIVNIEAQWSFVLALITLGSVPLWLILQKPTIANNFAVNAFYFLVCGVVTSLMKMEKPQPQSVDPRRQLGNELVTAPSSTWWG